MKTAEHWLDAAIKDCERLIAKNKAISEKLIPKCEADLTLPLSKEALDELEKIIKFDTRKFLKDQDKAYEQMRHYEIEYRRLQQLRLYLKLYT
jgi:hypothetical protein